MTYSVLMGLATQREEQIATRTRLPRPDAAPASTTTRRTGKRDRTRMLSHLGARAERA
jgi:hypothetical protein